MSILYAQASSPRGPVSWLWLSHPSLPGEMAPNPTQEPGRRCSGQGRALTPSPHPQPPPLWACMSSHPPIRRPPSAPGTEPAKNPPLGHIEIRPPQPSQLPLTPAFSAPCATPHAQLRSPVGSLYLCVLSLAQPGQMPLSFSSQPTQGVGSEYLPLKHLEFLSFFFNGVSVRVGHTHRYLVRGSNLGRRAA